MGLRTRKGEVDSRNFNLTRYRSRRLPDGPVLTVMQRKRVAFGVLAPRHKANRRFARAHANLTAELAHAICVLLDVVDSDHRTTAFAPGR